jgi:Transcriptional regulator, AbiEi antitoxin, Type IV TA system
LGESGQEKCYFQRMLKSSNLVKPDSSNLDQLAAERLQTILGGVPFLRPGKPLMQQSSGSSVPDLTLPVEVRGQSWTLVCEVKNTGQPRFVREGAFQLRKYLQALSSHHAYGIFIAPYLSEESAALLREESFGYLDFAGNCFLSFDGVFVERSGSSHTPERRRELREIFAPKASRVLRVLFADPNRSWRVTELAERAAVSLGQVSNVRRALLDREWASTDSQGLRLRKPGTILDAWSSAYAPRLVDKKEYYTLFHGKELNGAIKGSFASLPEGAHLVLASFSAAQWLAPFARSAGTHLYADEIGMAALREHLKLEPASRGANISVAVPKDDDVFIDSAEPAPGLRCTGLLQTYLDLSRAGDRGREAADHLRKTLLEPQWSTRL